MSKQYNKNIFGYADVICGEPLTDIPNQTNNLIFQDIPLITVNSVGGVGNVTIVLNFKLPNFDKIKYKLRQINYTISDSTTFVIKYYYDGAIFVPQTLRDGYNIISPSIPSDISLWPKTNIKNVGERLRLFAELQLNRGEYTIKVHAHKDGNWATEPYTLEGHYLLELK